MRLTTFRAKALKSTQQRLPPSDIRGSRHETLPHRCQRGWKIILVPPAADVVARFFHVPCGEALVLTPYEMIALLRCCDSQHPICFAGRIYGHDFVVDESDSLAVIALFDAFPDRSVFVADLARGGTRRCR